MHQWQPSDCGGWLPSDTAGNTPIGDIEGTPRPEWTAGRNKAWNKTAWGGKLRRDIMRLFGIGERAIGPVYRRVEIALWRGREKVYTSSQSFQRGDYASL